MMHSVELGMRIRRAAARSKGGLLGAIIVIGTPDEKTVPTDVIYPKIFQQVVALYLKEVTAAGHITIEEARQGSADNEATAEYTAYYDHTH